MDSEMVQMRAQEEQAREMHFSLKCPFEAIMQIYVTISLSFGGPKTVPLFFLLPLLLRVVAIAKVNNLLHAINNTRTTSYLWTVCVWGVKWVSLMLPSLQNNLTHFSPYQSYVCSTAWPAPSLLSLSLPRSRRLLECSTLPLTRSFLVPHPSLPSSEAGITLRPSS